MEQITDTILMIRPAHFGFNPETAENNAFQTNDTSRSPEEIKIQAREEFDRFVAKLRDAGVEVIVVEDTPQPVKTDAIFPNNWISLHADGRVITYPMYSNVRRFERRQDILDTLAQTHRIKERIHFEGAEAAATYLEGTGSMVFDRPNRICYACLSARTDEHLLNEFCQRMGYEKVAFSALDSNGREIYHTNVMMSVGTTFVVIVLDSVRNQDERKRLLSKFAETQKEVIELSMEQMNAFAGNMLQVRNKAGEPILVMSEQAYRSLTPVQIAALEKHTRILYSPIPVIEAYGGGSARCMMAEVFLPRKEK